MQIGSGYTKRDLCDGQTLASPGRWPVELRNYSEHETWLFVAGLYTDFARRVGTPTLLTSLALAKSQSHPSAVTASALSSTLLLRASHPEGLDWHVKKGIETMSRWTFAFWTCCCGQQEIQKSLWAPSPVASESVQGPVYRDSQHCTSRRQSGGSQTKGTQRTTKKRSSRGTRRGGRTTLL